ncbi:MAG: hypothetical protein LBQ52_05395 [Helicobacteraceae bacterium]|jgi:hypothetical protein|nr:hypothetical protein [Helicobacteraceae bacterium]
MIDRVINGLYDSIRQLNKELSLATDKLYRSIDDSLSVEEKAETLSKVAIVYTYLHEWGHKDLTKDINDIYDQIRKLEGEEEDE